jgi:hypothetical protein
MNPQRLPNPIDTSFEDFDKALQVLNDLKREGLIGDYAIGGAIAAMYYVQPFLTEDLDIFTTLPETPSGIVILRPIYEYLEKRGYKARGTYIDIGDTPMQFISIPKDSTLEIEAIKNAKEITFKKVKSKVVRAEYLIAFWLRSYRLKDQAKIEMLLDQTKINVEELENILKRYNLWDKWMDFRKRNR